MSELKKKFALPGGASVNKPLISKMIELYTDKRYLFRDDVEICAVYDAFFGVWNGGRVIEPETQSDKYIRSILEFYNSRGIPFRQIFTNFYAKYYLDDPQCNNIMRHINMNRMNECVVACDHTLSYLKEHYPNVRYFSSCTKALLDTELVVNEHKKDYDGVCLWIDMNKESVIKAIPEHLRDKTEILCCQGCKTGCPYVYHAYHRWSIANLKLYGKDVKYPSFTMNCHIWQPHTAEEMINLPTSLKHEQLDEFVKLGVNMFKITGRQSALGMFEMVKLFAYYLIKPECFEEYLSEYSNYIQKLRDTRENTATNGLYVGMGQHPEVVYNTLEKEFADNVQNY